MEREVEARANESEAFVNWNTFLRTQINSFFLCGGLVGRGSPGAGGESQQLKLTTAEEREERERRGKAEKCYQIVDYKTAKIKSMLFHLQYGRSKKRKNAF